MYKSKLQELCQSKRWKLPEYTTRRQGQDHCPEFEATVVVNGSPFSTPHLCKSTKEAHNLVAKIAYEHLTGNFSAGASDAGAPQVPCTSIDKASLSTGMNFRERDDKIAKDMAHLYKNQLQTYAQKRNLSLPKYTSEREGPPHAPRFKSMVMLDGRTYESNDYFCTIKDAENAAAKAALMSLSSDVTEEEDPGFFKNLLQELAQREYSCLPAYSTIRSGPSHNPVFVSTVEINKVSFTGQEAKTKKLAEMYAAKVAYIALRERTSPRCQVNDSSPMLLLPAAKLPDRHISAPNPASSEVSVEPVRCNQGVHSQGKEAKHTGMCPNEGRLHEPKVDALPSGQDKSNSLSAPTEHLSRLEVGNIYESSPSSSSGAVSSHKKIQVFPATPNMRLPPGVALMRKDDKWVAVSMDST